MTLILFLLSILEKRLMNERFIQRHDFKKCDAQYGSRKLLTTYQQLFHRLSAPTTLKKVDSRLSAPRSRFYKFLLPAPALNPSKKGTVP